MRRHKIYCCIIWKKWSSYYTLTLCQVLCFYPQVHNSVLSVSLSTALNVPARIGRKKERTTTHYYANSVRISRTELGGSEARRRTRRRDGNGKGCPFCDLLGYIWHPKINKRNYGGWRHEVGVEPPPPPNQPFPQSMRVHNMLINANIFKRQL